MAHIVGERRNDIRSNSVANCPLGLCKRSAARQDTEKKTRVGILTMICQDGHFRDSRIASLLLLSCWDATELDAPCCSLGTVRGG